MHVYNETPPFKDITWVPLKLVNVVPTKIKKCFASCQLLHCPMF